MSIEDAARWFSDNQQNWDDRADTHMWGNYGGFHELLADPSAISAVLAEDIDRFGDLHGQHVIHLQCHVGTDTLGFARRGADRVVGVDLSPNSLAYARKIAREAGVEVEFVEANVYDAATAVEGDFDLVYTSAGVLMWLPDLDRWARTVASLLKPGGVFFIRDDHPFFLTTGEDYAEGFSIRYPYFQSSEPITSDDLESYEQTEGAPTLTHTRSHTWNHPISEVVTALLGAGLTITGLEECAESAWQPWPEHMVATDTGKYRLREHPERLPLQYVVTARKPR